ncbi:hypothetical protein BZG36_03295 [Bifiguratus adelaidae]|uniref:PCI domain-containing protein n=1 Tax=Bifiguratus adelaidae TaxID=1938954 RepID=A0A261XZC7_9FUNG|nr:hypothetical protein BZG36_03295 [Bifiguratus adelaidae]
MADKSPEERVEEFTAKLQQLGDDKQDEKCSTLVDRAKAFQASGVLSRALDDVRTALQINKTWQPAIDLAAQLTTTQARVELQEGTAFDTSDLQQQLALISSGTQEDVRQLLDSGFFSELLLLLSKSQDAQKSTMALAAIHNVFQRVESLDGASASATAAEATSLQNLYRLCNKTFLDLLDGTCVEKQKEALEFLVSMFRAHPGAGYYICSQEGVLSELYDIVETSDTSCNILVVQILNHAYDNSKLRQSVAATFGDWISQLVSRTKGASAELYATAIPLATKMMLFKSQDPRDTQPSTADDAVSRLSGQRDALLQKIISAITEGQGDPKTHLSLVEALAYLSVEVDAREQLSKDNAFLKALVKLTISIPATNTALLYGVAEVLGNIAKFKDLLSEEERQISRLREMTSVKNAAMGKGRKLQSPTEIPLMKEDRVSVRVERLVQAGGVLALNHISKVDSENARLKSCQAFVGLSTPSKLRGILVQQGAVKTLRPLAVSQGHSYSPFAAHALAKIAISCNPAIAFPGTIAADLIKPFSALCEGDQLLRQFEALLALTNLTSASDDLRARAYKVNMLTTLENLQFSNNALIQRAATELLCNMLFYEPVFDAYTQDTKATSNKYKLLLAFADSEDLATRRAAGGALAILSQHPTACKLIMSHSIGIPNVIHMIAPAEPIEMKQRGIEIIFNLLQQPNIKVPESLIREGVTHLQALAQCQDSDVAEAANQCLSSDNSLKHDMDATTDYMSVKRQRGEKVVVIAAPENMDLESYIGNYKGHTKIERLLFIAERCPGLAIEAYTLAVAEIKANTLDTARYQATVNSLNNLLEKEGKAPLTVDQKWIELTSKKVKTASEKLEAELKSYKNNLIKESIRMGHNDLGDHYYACGDLGEALKCYTRARDYCTTPKHIIDMCVNVNIELGNYARIHSFVVKAESTQDVADKKSTLAWLKCCSALAHLDSNTPNKFKPAATCLLAVPFEAGSNLSELMSANDVAIYGVLLALASFNRTEIKTNIIDNAEFKNFLELEPQCRELVFAFYNSDYQTCLNLLQRMKDELHLDIHLHSHVDTIYNSIRKKALIQYFSPFLNVDLEKMAAAFNTDIKSLEAELVTLISEDEISARIDTHRKQYVSSQLCVITPLHALLWKEWVNCYVEKTDSAAEFFQRVVQHGATDASILGALGYCFVRMNRLEDAYAVFQQAVQDSQNAHASIGRGELCVSVLWFGIGIYSDLTNAPEHAEEAFTSVLRYNPDYEMANDIYFRLGIIYKKQQRYDLSLQCFRHVQANPPYPLVEADIYYQIGHVQELQKDYNLARDSYEHVLDQTPNHAKVLKRLGWLYHQSASFTNYATAIQLLSQALSLDDTDPETYFFLGRCYMKKQDYTKAKNAYQEAVNYGSKNAVYWCSIGVLYYQINQYRDALEAYTKAIKLNPELSETWYNLGTLYESCNDQFHDALDAYQKAWQLDPSNQHVRQRLELLRIQMGYSSNPASSISQPLNPSSYQGTSGTSSATHANGSSAAYEAQTGASPRPRAAEGKSVSPLDVSSQIQSPGTPLPDPSTSTPREQWYKAMSSKAPAPYNQPSSSLSTPGYPVSAAQSDPNAQHHRSVSLDKRDRTRMSSISERNRRLTWAHTSTSGDQRDDRNETAASVLMSFREENTPTARDFDGNDDIVNMLISKQNRKLIYEAIFKDGVLVAQKDFNAAKHPEIDVPNLEVIKSMQSLNSKGFVKTQFSWQYYYYTLTTEGIDYLREYLHLPSEIVPATFKKAARPMGARPPRAGGDREYRPRDRDDYRRKEGAGGDFKPEFRGGFGRGRREAPAS